MVCATVVLPVPAGPLSQHTWALDLLSAQDRMSCKILVRVSGLACDCVLFLPLCGIMSQRASVPMEVYMPAETNFFLQTI
jgi:hypothetical protein